MFFFSPFFNRHTRSAYFLLKGNLTCDIYDITINVYNTFLKYNISVNCVRRYNLQKKAQVLSQVAIETIEETPC